MKYKIQGRMRDIAILRAASLPYKKIASTLGISPNTVNVYVSKALRTLGVRFSVGHRKVGRSFIELRDSATIETP